MKLATVLLLSSAIAFGQGKTAQPNITQPQTKSEPALKLLPGVYAVLETSMGTITCELYERQVPTTVENFIDLAQGSKDYVDPKTGKPVHGKPYYDGITFHRVVSGFMIQT